MAKANIFFNQSYQDNPEQYPKQSGRLAEIYKSLTRKGRNQVAMNGLNFAVPKGKEMLEHVSGQLVGQIRELTNSKIIVFFGDGGTGLFLAGMNKLGDEIDPSIKENAVCLGPGGSYIHGAKQMGTDLVEKVVDFVEGKLEGRAQKVKIRNARVVKTDLETDRVISEQNHPFYGFAGTSFESYILELNEKKSRNGGLIKNAFEVLGQASRDVFDGVGKKVSRLRAFTTMPRWGFVRFWPEIDSLDNDSFYMLGSDNAGPIDVLKISTVVNLIGGNRHLLKAALAGIDVWKNSGRELENKSVADILDKFRPRRLEKFVEDFEVGMLGGLSYSTDGFPHRVNLLANQRARLEIDTIGNSGVTVMRAF